MALPDFRLLWLGYPHGASTEVKARLGGKLAYDWITNTCTIRTSHAFNMAGAPIPKKYNGLNVIQAPTGLYYAYRVAEFLRYMLAEYGAPDHVEEGEAGTITAAKFAGQQGVICFEVASWSDATGHFDLWNGTQTVHGEYFDRAHKVSLWSAATTSEPFALQKGVGKGQPNKKADVKVVQRLLNCHMADVGRVDGDCGPRTIYAIQKFQEWYDLPPNGQVSPDGVTFRRLTQG
ncbi:MAG: T6SS effector amidase Tae4 family protein [bacterium]